MRTSIAKVAAAIVAIIAAFSLSPAALADAGDPTAGNANAIQAAESPALTTQGSSTGAQAMYRLYNPNSGEHFYTAAASERNNLVKIGWNYEGVGWMAPQQGDPVFRLYNAAGGEHHYTLSSAERDWLVSLGWSYEGEGWRSAGQNGVPLFRVYNPNAFANNHHYTVETTERNWLLGLGWRNEGTAWYALDIDPVDPDPLADEDVELLKLDGWWQVQREGGVRVYHFTGDDLYYYRVTSSSNTGWNLDDPTISVKLASHHKVSLKRVENVHVNRAASLVNGHGPGSLVSAPGLGSSYYVFDDEPDMLYDSSGSTMCFKRIASHAALLEAAKLYEHEA